MFLLNDPPDCATVIQYSTHLNDQPEDPVFKKSAAFLFKYQAVASKNESKVRVFFFPFPKIPDVNLTAAEELLNLEKKRMHKECHLSHLIDWQHLSHSFIRQFLRPQHTRMSHISVFAQLSCSRLSQLHLTADFQHTFYRVPASKETTFLPPVQILQEFQRKTLARYGRWKHACSL